MEDDKKKLVDRRLFKFSHKLSKFLRHELMKFKDEMVITPNGYCLVSQLLKNSRFSQYTLEDLSKLEETDQKQRYHIHIGLPYPELLSRISLELPQTLKDEAESDTTLWVRANQGHSFELEDPDYEVIQDSSQAPIVVHGTSFNSWKEILATKGLKKMGRSHIHFAPGLLGTEGVISGMRRNCEVFIYINLTLALQDGIPFFLSPNQVILSPGVGIEGQLPLKYFEKVVDNQGRDLLQFTLEN